MTRSNKKGNNRRSTGTRAKSARSRGKAKPINVKSIRQQSGDQKRRASIDIACKIKENDRREENAALSDIHLKEKPVDKTDIAAQEGVPTGRAPSRLPIPIMVSEKQVKKVISATQSLGEKGKIPVTILTGFLGSGKTTFVNYLLKERHGMKIAIIENEFGEVGVDDGLVLQTNEEVIEMMNGCICCTVRDDLIIALKRLITQRRHQFDIIVIETTGLADPAPVAQTFFVDEDIQELFKLDAIVTFVDAKHALEHLKEEKPEGVENEAVEQVAFADVLVVNKTDLVTAGELKTLKTELTAINAGAKMYECQQAKVPVDKVINIGAFDLQKTIAMDDAFLDTEGEHMHDKSVTSVGIVIEGEFLEDKFNDFLSDLLQTKGADIFRSKGILAVANDDRKFVFQGVHMLLKMGTSEEFDMEHKNWQPGERRINRMCFIGRNLIRKDLEEKMKACIFNGKNPEPGPVPKDHPRFNIGTEVLCNVGTWEPAIIVKHWFREDLWETGKYVPYQAEIKSTEELIYVPRDHPSYIRPMNKKRKTKASKN